jgi:alpha-beta hydrolase superfamily lysophospholipase
MNHRSATTFHASDGADLFVHRWMPELPPRAAVQVVHGYAEHGGRYDRLATALNDAGYAVYAHDIRGHGRSVRTPADLGFFAECDGWQECIEDLWQLNQYISADLPDRPIVLLGHSLGSFMAQHFMSVHGDAVDGVILSGTAGSLSHSALAIRAGLAVAQDLFGPHARNTVINQLMLELFNERCRPARTPYDWLTRDAGEVDRFLTDPFCAGFEPSVQFAIDLLEGLNAIGQGNQLKGIPRSLPIHVIAGTCDPMGEYTIGVQRLLAAYRAAGLQRVTHRFYSGARHALFHETNREEISAELITWIDTICGERSSASPVRGESIGMPTSFRSFDRFDAIVA